MPTELINIMIQLPVVVAFIWYSQFMNKQFQEFLREQREADRQVMERMISQLDRIDKAIVEHDEKTDLAVARMDERTKPRPTNTIRNAK